MYLIHAEAALKGRGDTATAEADIKALEGRALNFPTSSFILMWDTPDRLLKIIGEERKKELCFEGHRFFDMLRNGENLSRPSSSNAKIKSLTYPDYRFLLPIDRMECQYNEYIQQNEGYDDYKTN